MKKSICFAEGSRKLGIAEQFITNQITKHNTIVSMQPPDSKVLPKVEFLFVT